MKIHKCYKQFAQGNTPQYPDFKVLIAGKLIDGKAYDVYHFESIINEVPRLTHKWILQNTKVDIQSEAVKAFKQWVVEVKR